MHICVYMYITYMIHIHKSNFAASFQFYWRKRIMKWKEKIEASYSIPIILCMYARRMLDQKHQSDRHKSVVTIMVSSQCHQLAGWRAHMKNTTLLTFKKVYPFTKEAGASWFRVLFNKTQEEYFFCCEIIKLWNF